MTVHANVEIKTGDGSIEISHDSDGFSIWIDHDGVGDEGGTVSLEWVSRVTTAQMRELGEAILKIAADSDGPPAPPPDTDEFKGGVR